MAERYSEGSREPASCFTCKQEIWIVYHGPNSNHTKEQKAQVERDEAKGRLARAESLISSTVKWCEERAALSWEPGETPRAYLACAAKLRGEA